MTILIKIINILILFNLGYWGFYFLTNIFYKIDKIETLVVYLIIGFVIALFTTKEKTEGSKSNKDWAKLMNKLDSKNKPPKYIIIFIRTIGWPIGLSVTTKNSLKNTSPNTG